jgi:ABC-2 type transport system ATP-binding protein
VTVVITTHLMDEAEQLADDVVIVNHGRVLVRGTPHSLMAATGGAQVRFRTNPALDVKRLQERMGLPVRLEPGSGFVIEQEPSPAVISALAIALEEQHTLLSELRVGNPSLEEAFLELTGTEVRNGT